MLIKSRADGLIVALSRRKKNATNIPKLKTTPDALNTSHALSNSSLSLKNRYIIYEIIIIKIACPLG
jgi:hypothetical protein